MAPQPTALHERLGFSQPWASDPLAHMHRLVERATEDFRPPFDPVHHKEPTRRAGTPPAVIEEVHDDGPTPPTTSCPSRSAPIVEEPDDDAQTQCCPAAHRPRRNSLSTAWRDTKGGGGQRAPGGSLLDAFFFFGGGDGDDLFPSPLGRRQPFDLLAKLEEPPLGGKACYTLSASSFVSRGPEGVEYREAHACRTGPGGVREAQSVVQDGRTGRRSMSVTRGLGERERTVTRVRDAGGRVMGDERLRGIAKDQTDSFEREWMEQARRNLLLPDALDGLRSARDSAPHSRVHRLDARASTTTALPAPPAGRPRMPPTAAHGAGRVGAATTTAAATDTTPASPALSRAHSVRSSCAPPATPLAGGAGALAGNRMTTGGLSRRAGSAAR